MLELNFDKAVQLVQDCIAQRGEAYEYIPEGDSCKYVHGTEVEWYDHETRELELRRTDKSEWTPGCIVGLALSNAGISLALLENSNSEDATDLIDTLADLGHLAYTDKAKIYLRRVQHEQDNQTPWGKAHSRGLALAESHPNADDETLHEENQHDEW